MSKTKETNVATSNSEILYIKGNDQHSEEATTECEKVCTMHNR